MLTELRQRRPSSAPGSKRKIIGTMDSSDTKKVETPLKSSNSSWIKYLPLVALVWLFMPVLVYVPQALYIFAKGGFDIDDLLGAGIMDMVGNLVEDPKAMIAWKHMKHLEAKPSPMVLVKDKILEEYETYRATHEIPIISEMDPEEQLELDPKKQWKTLFLRAMGRSTCAAKYFPQTLAAVEQSGFVPYSIMISRMAPGQTIEPHTGFSKMIQIYHMALKVPNNDYPTNNATDAMRNKPYLQVQECPDYANRTSRPECHRIETYHWKEGQEFIFDDSFPHWTHNPTNEERLIFFLHIARVDFKSWREELIARIAASVFSWVPFPGVMRLVTATEATCS